MAKKEKSGAPSAPRPEKTGDSAKNTVKSGAGDADRRTDGKSGGAKDARHGTDGKTDGTDAAAKSGAKDARRGTDGKTDGTDAAAKSGAKDARLSGFHDARKNAGGADGDLERQGGADEGSLNGAEEQNDDLDRLDDAGDFDAPDGTGEKDTGRDAAGAGEEPAPLTFNGKPVHGNRYSNCAVCNRRFEHSLTVFKNVCRYDNFKTCRPCRNAALLKTKLPSDSAEQAERRITLSYKPHPAQQKFHESRARFRVLCCGARFGKDISSMAEGIKVFFTCLSENRPATMTPSVNWWIIAPTEQIADQNWKYLKRFFPKQFVSDISNGNMQMTTVGGGMISVWSAYDPESLVSQGVDIATITEAARVRDLKTVWSNVSARLQSPGRGPNGTGGVAIINSSPIQGAFYFEEMFWFGQADSPKYDPDWESWRFTTWDNPEIGAKKFETKTYKVRLPDGSFETRVSKPYWERWCEELGELRYRQDILAEFVGDDAKCFPKFETNCVTRLPFGLSPEERRDYLLDWQRYDPAHSYALGYDPASKHDIPAVLVGDRDTGRIVRIADLSGQDWPRQWDSIAALSREYGWCPVIFSQTGHETIDHELRARGLITMPVNEQGHNKQAFIENYEACVERGEIQVLDDDSREAKLLIEQHKDYSAIVRGKTVTFSNVNCPHDDFVSAGYVLFWEIRNVNGARACVPGHARLGGVKHRRR